MVPIWLLLGLGGLVLAGCGGDSDNGGSGDGAELERVSGPLPHEGELLFVVRGDATVSGSTLEVDTQTVEWFTNRPERKAGVAEIEELVSDWDDYGFADSAPNAALTGGDTDAVVELKNPKSMPGGVAFDFKKLRGEVKAEDTGELSVFIDSPYTTDMHVYVQFSQNTWCSNDRDQLINPQVIRAPNAWYKQPVTTVGPSASGGGGFEIFTAASVSGQTNFEVQYTMTCGGQGQGTVTFTGKVPTQLIYPNSFSCPLNDANPGLVCSATPGKGFHVDSYAVIETKQQAATANPPAN